MKRNEGPKGPMTKPLLQDLINRKKADDKRSAPVPAIAKSSPKQPGRPARYEDAGSGFNSDFTFPQE